MGGLFKAGGAHSKLADPLKLMPDDGPLAALHPGIKHKKKVETPQAAAAPKGAAPNAARVALRRQPSLGGPATASPGGDPALGR